MAKIVSKTLKKSLPDLPGIYLFKDADGTVVYIGKAKSLKKRVSSYFQNKQQDLKTELLLQAYDDLDFIVTHSETEALLLEIQLVQKHQPKFNILLKDGQPFLYIVFTKAPIPEMEIVRNKKLQGIYFGPFLHKQQARKVFNYLQRTFKLTLCNKRIENGCLEYHLGLCAGNCRSDFDLNDYLFRIQLAQDVLHRNHKDFLKNLQSKIKEYSSALEFEKARALNRYAENFETIFATIETHFSEKKYELQEYAATAKTYVPHVSEDIAQQLKDFFELDHLVRTIDCFDVSHFQSRNIVGSCVRFTDAKPDKNNLRRFNIKTLEVQNDYAALQEIVSRRYRDGKNIPDLIVIDGGKGQLSAIREILPDAPVVSLAKREETIYCPQFPEGKRLDIQTEVGRLIIALRDYAHHFAISFHRLKRAKSNS
jgi:excinuclease ABC subunit C